MKSRLIKDVLSYNKLKLGAYTQMYKEQNGGRE